MLVNEINVDYELRELAIKYRKMNIFKRLIFRIKNKICRPKIDWTKLAIFDTQTILENLPRENKSYNEIIKENFNG